MHTQRQLRTTRSLALSLAMVTSLALAAVAQDATVQGMVIGRDGPQMAVRTADTPRLIVLLSDNTKATQKGGFLGMGGKDLGVESLVPGLSVKVEGSYNPDHQLLAKKVVFSKGSLTTARAIDAGLNPVNAKLGEQQDQLAIGQTNTRIGTLDQYETKDSMTINFANGQATVKRSDKDALTDFVKSAANTPGFMIEVQGYASTVGSATLNQRLSAERADNVLAIIQQSGAVPMTRILAPAAMGTSNQVDDGHTRKAQAQNRRVVVTIVVNKGIVGSTGS